MSDHEKIDNVEEIDKQAFLIMKEMLIFMRDNPSYSMRRYEFRVGVSAFWTDENVILGDWRVDLFKK